MLALNDVPLTAFLVFPLVVGCAVQFSTEPPARAWHRTLRKSEFTPPPAAFPIVWVINFLNMGFASYRVVKAGGGNAQTIIYLAHVALLNSWNLVIFLTRRLGLSFCIMMLLITSTPLLILEFASWDRLAGIVLLPYYLWLLLLSHLSYFLWAYNPGPQFGIAKDE
eukprot:IDg9721t1